MADFDEDYEEPFYQEVPEETGLFQLLLTKAKENPLCFRPFLVQCSILLFVLLTESSFQISEIFSGLLKDYWLLATISFFVFITLLTVFEIKRQEHPCLKIALPNILLQTDLFYTIIMSIGTAYGNFGIEGYLMVIAPNLTLPVIPAFVGILFLLGCVIDNFQPKNRNEMAIIGKRKFTIMKRFIQGEELIWIEFRKNIYNACTFIFFVCFCGDLLYTYTGGDGYFPTGILVYAPVLIWIFVQVQCHRHKNYFHDNKDFTLFRISSGVPPTFVMVIFIPCVLRFLFFIPFIFIIGAILKLF